MLVGMLGIPGMLGMLGMLGIPGMLGALGMLTEAAATPSAHSLVSSFCASSACRTVPRQLSTVFCQASGL